MIVDIKERQPATMMPAGVVSQISFTRLIELLRAAGEIRPDEIVTHINLDLAGFTYRVEHKA